MKRLTSKQLRTIRIFVIVVGILISFFIWLSWPDVINNNPLSRILPSPVIEWEPLLPIKVNAVLSLLNVALQL